MVVSGLEQRNEGCEHEAKDEGFGFGNCVQGWDVLAKLAENLDVGEEDDGEVFHAFFQGGYLGASEEEVPKDYSGQKYLNNLTSWISDKHHIKSNQRIISFKIFIWFIHARFRCNSQFSLLII